MNDLLTAIKTAVTTDSELKTMLEIGNDSGAAVRISQQGYAGTTLVSRVLDKLGVGILAGPAVALPILAEILALSGQEPATIRTQTAAFVMDSLSIGKSLDFGDPLTRDRIGDMQESTPGSGDGLAAESVAALLSLGVGYQTVTASEVSAAMVSVRINGTAQTQENWSTE